ncbi:uncharacterized protein LOC126632451 isoform X1 [Malus sylvestris]|uniref:uncharacterized protein LOC126632451 isoform X1 n=1 Tax=Malus sylvestris TaxID=3752 RepID=UPI0021AC931F|nr:uncharacterized protein LOC126632451 isoform X1 [Malus sylvestris]
MVSGLNAVEIAVGGVAGAAFGSIFDGITEVLRNAAEFTTSHTNIKSTLEALQPLIREIEGKNNRLLLQDEELKDLKNEIEAGVKRVQEFSERSVWNYCKRPFYNMELDGMDKSLKRLLRILQVQGVRDVKEVLVQVNGCKTDVNKISTQLDDCTTEIVEGISAWKSRTTDQLDQVASNGKEILDLTRRMFDRFERINGSSSFVPISEKVASLVQGEALGSSLLTMRHAVDEALSKPNPHYNIFRIEEALRRAVEELGDADENRKLEEGTELIRKCSNVVEWTDRKMVKYANKLDDLVKFLEAFGQRLKRNNITMPKGFDTQNSIPCITYSVDYGENRTEIENEKLIFMKSNQPTDDVNDENRTEIENEMLIFKKSNRPTDDVNGLRNDGKIGHHDSSVSGYSSNFAEENKLGEGGFGPVYKGKLAMGQKKAVKWHRMLFFKKSNRPTDGVNGLRNDGKIGHHDSSVFSYSSILAATSNFAEENKIGEGGFGPVYKGKLAMGQEIAVKRLSKRSGQGLSEFKNELILNELQHTNLVHLFGFCIHGEEKMLIYEYMQNKSLEHFLFDFGLARIFTQNELEANTSRIVVNPKISDFGTARMFTQNELEPNTTLTTRIVGTRQVFLPHIDMVFPF